MQALLAELDGRRGLQSIVAEVPYLRECTDDLNSTSRVMRKFLDDNTHIFYGPDATVDADFLKERFLTWKAEQGIRINTPGEHSIKENPSRVKLGSVHLASSNRRVSTSITVQDHTTSGTTRRSRMRSVLPSVGCGRSAMPKRRSSPRTPAA